MLLVLAIVIRHHKRQTSVSVIVAHFLMVIVNAIVTGMRFASFYLKKKIVSQFFLSNCIVVSYGLTSVLICGICCSLFWPQKPAIRVESEEIKSSERSSSKVTEELSGNAMVWEYLPGPDEALVRDGLAEMEVVSQRIVEMFGRRSASI